MSTLTLLVAFAASLSLGCSGSGDGGNNSRKGNGAAGNGDGGDTGEGGDGAGGSGARGGSSGASTAGSGMGGSATGGSGSGARGGQGGTGGGPIAGSFYLLWSDLQTNAFITELDRQTGEVIRNVPVAMGPSLTAMDLAVSPDGTLRVMYPVDSVPFRYATIWIFDPALQPIDSSNVGVEFQAYMYAKRRDGTGRLWDAMNVGGVPSFRMWPLDALDLGITSTTPIFRAPAEVANRNPIDYFPLPNGEGRVLTSVVGSGQSRVFFLDQNEVLTPNFVEYDHAGVESVSYAVYEDGVWTSYSRADGGVICAAASESEVVFDVADEGWGVGACRAFAPPAAGYAFWDLAGPP